MLQFAEGSKLPTLLHKWATITSSISCVRMYLEQAGEDIQKQEFFWYTHQDDGAWKHYNGPIGVGTHGFGRKKI